MGQCLGIVVTATVGYDLEVYQNVHKWSVQLFCGDIFWHVQAFHDMYLVYYSACNYWVWEK